MRRQHLTLNTARIATLCFLCCVVQLVGLYRMRLLFEWRLVAIYTHTDGTQRLTASLTVRALYKQTPKQQQLAHQHELAQLAYKTHTFLVCLCFYDNNDHAIPRIRKTNAPSSHPISISERSIARLITFSCLISHLVCVCVCGFHMSQHMRLYSQTKCVPTEQHPEIC